jgi:hypothetical protein
MLLSDWLKLVGDAARELAEIVLRVPHAAFVRVPGAPPLDRLQGVYLPLFSGNRVLQLALLAEARDCAKLARWFLRLPPGAELDSDSQALEAMGEFTQLIAGSLEARLEGKRQVRLGLPLGLRGPASPLGKAHSVEGVLEIEDSLFWLVISGVPAAHQE